ncbi:HAD family phosphatase [Limosilactobacillus pontis]|uniref:HAD family hydrolase n=1 Tax=Limosilactobacillus pontis TaxID=35787 RepID=UPI002F261F2C
MQGAILNVNGIITDLDRRQFAAWQQVAMYEYGMGLPGKLAGDFKGLSRPAALDRVLAHFNDTADEDRRQELLETQDRFYGQVLAKLDEDDLVPGIKRLLVALYDHYVKLAINDPVGHGDEIAKRLKLDEYIDVVGTADDPAAPYQALLAQMDVPATGCIALVTNQADLQSAAAARLTTIGVGDADQLAAADYQVRQVGDLRYQMIEKVWEDTHEDK